VRVGGFDGLGREDLVRIIAEQNAALSQANARCTTLEGTLRAREQETAILREQVHQLQTVVATLQREVATLRSSPGGDGESGGGSPRRQPPEWAKPNRPERPKAARRKRAQGYARRRAVPTEQVRHVPERCPHDGTPLVGGWVHHRRQVLELPAAPLRVIEHVILARRCATCRRSVVAKPRLAGVVVGQQRVGIGLVSWIAALRTTGRLPLETIQWLLEARSGLRLSLGGLQSACATVATAGKPLLERWKQEIDRSPVLQADETGWREDGTNGYVWLVRTPTTCLFHRGPGRGRAVAERLLGQAEGTLGTDGYAAYDWYPGLHQRCWVHILREVHELKLQHPEDTALWAWAAHLKGLYQEACETPLALSPPERTRRAAAYEARLLALCAPFLGTDTPQRAPCTWLSRHVTELFTFVRDPQVPPDNNAAERAVRPLVTARKISGGTRSSQGTTVRLALASLFTTWTLRGQDPLLACQQLLASTEP